MFASVVKALHSAFENAAHVRSRRHLQDKNKQEKGKEIFELSEFLLSSFNQGDTLIYLYIRRLGSFFGFKILNFNIFGGFQKN